MLSHGHPLGEVRYMEFPPPLDALVSDGRSDEWHVRLLPLLPEERELSSAGDVRPGRLML